MEDSDRFMDRDSGSGRGRGRGRGLFGRGDRFPGREPMPMDDFGRDFRPGDRFFGGFPQDFERGFPSRPGKLRVVWVHVRQREAGNSTFEGRFRQ